MQLGESVASITKSSPALVAALDSKDLQSTLKSTQRAQALIGKQISFLTAQTRDTYESLKKLQSELAKTGNAEQEKQRAATASADLQKQHQLEAAKIEASRAALFFITTFVGVVDARAADRIQAVGSSLVRGWEAVDHCEQSIVAGGSDATRYAELVLLANWVSGAVTIINAFSAHQDSTAMILEQLAAIKVMIRDLYEMTAKRFDRLEVLLQRYESINLDAFRTLFIQGEITSAHVDMIRTALLKLNGSEVQREVKDDFKSQNNNTFAALQRKCFSQSSFRKPTSSISDEMFLNCLSEFVSYAIDVSASKPFSDRSPTAWLDDSLPLDLASNPYEHLNVLAIRAAQLGSAADMSAAVANPIVWSNGSMAALKTLEAWPDKRDKINVAGFSELANKGRALSGSVESLFVDKNGRANSMMFFNATVLYYDKINAVGRILHRLADQYAEQETGGVNPFEYSALSTSFVSPKDDPRFEKALGTDLPKCAGGETNLPDFIPVPPGIGSQLVPEFRVAARLGKSHTIVACYDVYWSNKRVYLYKTVKSGTTLLGYKYFIDPVLRVFLRSKGYPTVVLEGTLPTTFLEPQNATARRSDHSEFADRGEYTDAGVPAEITGIKVDSGSKWPFGFNEWLRNGGLNGFADRVKLVGWLHEGGQSADPNIAARQFQRAIDKEIADLEIVFSQELFTEMYKEGDLSTALDELGGVKRLLEALVKVGFPESISTDVELQRRISGDLQLFDKELLIQGLTSSNPDFDTEKISDPGERLRAGIRRIMSFLIKGNPVSVATITNPFAVRAMGMRILLMKIAPIRLMKEPDPVIDVTLQLLETASSASAKPVM